MKIKERYFLAIVVILLFPTCVIGDEDQGAIMLFKRMNEESSRLLFLLDNTEKLIENKIGYYEKLLEESSSGKKIVNNTEIFNIIFSLKKEASRISSLKPDVEMYNNLSFIFYRVYCKSKDCGLAEEDLAQVLEDLGDLTNLRSEAVRIRMLVADIINF